MCEGRDGAWPVGRSGENVCGCVRGTCRQGQRNGHVRGKMVGMAERKDNWEEDGNGVN